MANYAYNDLELKAAIIRETGGDYSVGLAHPLTMPSLL